MTRPRWFVRTTAKDGSVSTTYGPGPEWARILTMLCLRNPGIDWVESGPVEPSDQEDTNRG